MIGNSSKSLMINLQKKKKNYILHDKLDDQARIACDSIIVTGGIPKIFQITKGDVIVQYQIIANKHQQTYLCLFYKPRVLVPLDYHP